MNDVQWLDESDFTPVPDGSARNEAIAARPRHSAKQPRNIRLLVVEDNPADVRLLQIALWGVTGATFDVWNVGTLSQALERMGQQPFDLILLDLGLPDSQGLDTFLQFREHARKAPVIVLTGNADESAAIQAIREGAQDYLLKGTDAITLIRAMRYAMGRQRMRRRAERALEAARASEANLRKIIDRNLDGIVVVDSRSTVLHANAAAENLVGYPAGRFVGQLFAFPLSTGGSEIELANLNGVVIPTEMRVAQIDWDGQSAYLVLLHDLREQRQVEANRQKLLLARQVQRALLPTATPVVPGFVFAASSIAADETGGDYFDWVPMPAGCLGLVVGDASDHGIAAAVLISEVAGALRAFGSMLPDVDAILTAVNRQLAPRTLGDQFATVFLARIDPAARTLTYANAGHPPALLFDDAGQMTRQLDSLDLPIAVQPDHQLSRSEPIPLPPGSLAVILSDGVLEASNSADELFGIDRVVETVRAHRHRTAQQIVEAVCEAVRAFIAPALPRDDLTVMIVKVI
jgi:serine phosphatase RsbU (regulator of sigma subunit)/DNA-binding response OmpR family regulator